MSLETRGRKRRNLKHLPTGYRRSMLSSDVQVCGSPFRNALDKKDRKRLINAMTTTAADAKRYK
ncbi:MAG: hypothetical protein M3129_04185 [Thermoproteota archaeon]|nr:hypothetical protein [Thermoproteota archaeon]